MFASLTLRVARHAKENIGLNEQPLTHRRLHRDGSGPKRTDDTLGQACRIAFASLRQTHDFFSDRCRRASRSATFNRFRDSSKAAVIAAVSSGLNAVLRVVIGISNLPYCCQVARTGRPDLALPS